ncbi:hypothetical protein [Lactiplantibacillus modestisalitolerans]|uniref:Uncharacterized protein n=1 Tax=Lactiplantibacillus modestisalitolerans TaxID=1457219 RepID=A0ABV5WWY4_9LACO|nr:hypothetical protein [Lactiplantibacillus modestisalitolerans]
MLAMKLPPVTLAQETVVVNGELSYQLQLTRHYFGKHPLELKITAATLLGCFTVNQESFDDLALARATFDAYLNDLVQK